MDVHDYLEDIQKNRGVLYFSPSNKRMCRLVKFWAQFEPDNRPFATNRHLVVRQDGSEDQAVQIPLIVLNPTDLANLARYNGSKGLLTIRRDQQ